MRVSTMKLFHASCRQCGAPLKLTLGQQLVICAFCNATMRADGAAEPALQAVPAVAPEVIERIKRLVLDGKRDAAIDLCASTHGVLRDEAKKTVDQMMLPAVSDHFRHLPINALGFLIGFVLIGGGSALAAYGVSEVLAEHYGGLAFALPGVLLAFLGVRYLVPKAIATFIAAYGARGRAAVRRRTILAENIAGNGVLVLVLLEVTPDQGGAPFVDQEAVLVRDDRVERLTPGNVIAVRFNGSRDRVFPISPIDVIGRA